jgi:hypothetical protein
MMMMDTTSITAARSTPTPASTAGTSQIYGRAAEQIGAPVNPAHQHNRPGPPPPRLKGGSVVS